MDNSIIGQSVVIRGELTAKDDLTIEGRVEGKVELANNGLSIGQHGTLKAQVLAKTVVVLGKAGARMRSSASPGTRSTRPAASSGSRPPARRRWWGGFCLFRNPLPRPSRGGGHGATPTVRWSSTATASPSAAGARRGALPARRPGCRPASSTIAAAPPPAT